MTRDEGRIKLAAMEDQGLHEKQRSPDYFGHALEDAERLLKYAAEKGITVDDTTRMSVLHARATFGAEWDEATTAGLLAGLTKLAAQLYPVTAESLQNFDTRPTVRKYWAVAICLAVIIVPFSVASFISSVISDSIGKDITTANALAVQLTAQLEAVPTQTNTGAGAQNAAPPPPLPAGVSRIEIVTELQSFASLIREIYSRSQQLNLFVFGAVQDPFKAVVPEGGYKQAFQLHVPLPADLTPVLNGRITVYQDARQFGKDVTADTSIFYGAMSACILPVLYALLGTCAYLLRGFSEEMRNRTFVPSHSDSARFLIAAIGGGVVGLFGNFTINQTASISPFAIAFLVGYAVDVFFSFLEGMIQAFTKSKSGGSASPQEPAPTGSTSNTQAKAASA